MPGPPPPGKDGIGRSILGLSWSPPPPNPEESEVGRSIQHCGTSVGWQAATGTDVRNDAARRMITPTAAERPWETDGVTTAGLEPPRPSPPDLQEVGAFAAAAAGAAATACFGAGICKPGGGP